MRACTPPSSGRGRHWWLALLVAAALASVGPSDAKPERVVSLNLCADQLLLLLADRERIASITYLSPDPHTSYMAQASRGLHINHGRLEEILPLEPDLVLTGRFSARTTAALLRKLDYRVVEFAIPIDFEGIRNQLRRVGALLGEPDKAKALVESLDQELAAAKSDIPPNPPLAVIYRPNGFTAGRGTLEHVVLEAAGLRNLAAEVGLVGYGRLSLEHLLSADPDILVFGSDKSGPPSLAEATLRHPALDKARETAKIVILPNNLWRCAGPMVAEALARLRMARQP
jgi:iron complex transport system substrate-binding protein